MAICEVSEVELYYCNTVAWNSIVVSDLELQHCSSVAVQKFEVVDYTERFLKI